MTIKIRTFPANQIDGLEAKLNDILSKPESAGYSLVSVCPITTNTSTNEVTLLLIFQKP
ncbi:MAG: hypothetical protein ACREIF_10765 [Chthoniobacterales bacterium]